MSVEALNAALAAAKPVLATQFAAIKGQFLADFGALVDVADIPKLDGLFVQACQAKLAQMGAMTAAQAQEAKETYEAILDEVELIGLDLQIIGKAKAGKFLRAAIHMAIAALAAGAGAAVSIAIEAALPGAGFILGPLAGAGLKAVIEEFNT